MDIIPPKAPRPAIAWAHELDPNTKKEALKLFLINDMTRLPTSVTEIEWHKDIWIIQENDAFKCYAYINEQYFGPYKWEELAILLRDDKELRDLFFASFADDDKGFKDYTQFWVGMSILLRYAYLDEYTLPAVGSQFPSHTSRLLSSALMKALDQDIDQVLLEHASRNITLLLLGERVNDSKPEISGLLNVESLQMSKISQFYQALSFIGEGKTKDVLTNFSEQLKEMETRLLKRLSDMESMSDKFDENKLDLIVKSDVSRLLKSKNDIQSVWALSGDRELLLERWIEKCFDSVYNQQTFKRFYPVKMLFELYYCLRELPTAQKELLLQRNEDLFNKLEEYVLACLCNRYILGDVYYPHARDRELKLSAAKNTQLLNPQNDGLRQEVFWDIDVTPKPLAEIDKAYYGEHVYNIVVKYWNLYDEQGRSRLNNNQDRERLLYAVHRDKHKPAGSAYNLSSNRDPAMYKPEGCEILNPQGVDTVEIPPAILMLNQQYAGNTVKIPNEGSRTNVVPRTDAATVDDKAQIPGKDIRINAVPPPTQPTQARSPFSGTEYKLAMTLAIVAVVIARYFLYERSWSHAVGMNHISAVRGLFRETQISNHK